MSYTPESVSPGLFWLMVVVSLWAVSMVVVIWFMLKRVRAGAVSLELSMTRRQAYRGGAVYGAHFDGAVATTLVCLLHWAVLYLAPDGVLTVVSRWLVLVPAVWAIYNGVRVQTIARAMRWI